MNFKNSISINSLIVFISILSAINILSCDLIVNNNITIEGKISEANKEKIILEKINQNKVDSVKSCTTNRNGNFEIKLKNYDDGFYRLRTVGNNTIFLYLKCGDEVNIEASYPEINKNYEISGSKDSRILRDIYYELLEYSEKIKKIREKVVEAYYTIGYNVDSLKRESSIIASQMFESAHEYLINMIDINKESPVIYIILHQYFDTKNIFTLENDLETFEYVLHNLKTYNPELPQIKTLENNISSYKLRLQQKERSYLNISHGTKAPDFSLYNSENDKVTLYSFENKTKVLYFWASWSNVSVKNLENLTKIKERIGDNIDIITISLDYNLDKWKEAINYFKIQNLINLSDLRGWESPVTKIYSITSIPVFIIINENEIIESVTSDVEIFNNDLTNILK